MTTTPEPAPARTRKLLLIGAGVVGSVVILAVAASIVAGMVSSGDTGPTTEPGIPVTVSIQPGEAASTIYRTLADAGVVAYAAIEQAVHQANAESSLQAGTYALETGMDAGEVLRLLLEGGNAPESRTITIVEGWTVARIIEELADATEFTVDDFAEALSNGAVTSPLLTNAPEQVSPLSRWEGLLYPATYQIPTGATPAAMLQTMADEMVARFEGTDWAGLQDTDLSRYEILIIGSLIEREAGVAEDRPLISSVIHNRLATGMRLQIDATVIYALGGNPGQVLASHLETDSPYNTYRIDGLPPTPIGTVSTASLKAAIAPADTDYLFYVLASTDGAHAFAVTYEEHKANVERAKREGILP
ncbi:MAG: endolytic transglycosylase MltG [Acidimicrobiia bacterium]